MPTLLVPFLAIARQAKVGSRMVLDGPPPGGKSAQADCCNNPMGEGLPCATTLQYQRRLATGGVRELLSNIILKSVLDTSVENPLFQLQLFRKAKHGREEPWLESGLILER